MRSVKVALAVALVLLAVAIGAVLSRAPLTVAGTNSIPVPAPVALTRGNVSSCQAGTLPKGTSAIRVSLSSGAGPRLRLKVFSGSRLITQGERAAGWGLEGNVVIPVKAVPGAVRNARICTEVGPAAEPVGVLGRPIGPGSAQQRSFKAVKLRFEYLRPGPKSWLSLASSISYHMGLGHAASGKWLALLVLAAMIEIVILVSQLAWEELR